MSIEAQIDNAIKYKHCALPDIGWASASFPDHQAEGMFIDRAVSAYGDSLLKKRPAGNRLLNELRPGDHVVCWSIDRMFRNIGDFGTMIRWFEKRQVVLHFINDNIDFSTAFGKLKASIYAVLAEHYSNLLSFRVKEAHAIKRARMNGQAPAKKKTKDVRVVPPATSKVDPGRYAIVNLHAAKKSKTVQTIKRAWGYVRVSSDSQVESGLGLEYQTRDVEAYKKILHEQSGVVLMDTVADEAISAFKVPFPERPGGKRILSEAKAGDVVIVYRSDRIFRSLQDALATITEFQRRGLIIHLIDERVRTDSEDGRWYLSLLVMLAELESKMKSDRVKSVLQRKKSQGLKYAHKSAFYTPKEFGGQVRMVPSIAKTARYRLAWTLWREVGLTKANACAVANILFHQKWKKPYCHLIFSTWKERQKAEIVMPGSLLFFERSWDELVATIGDEFRDRVLDIVRDCLATEFDDRSNVLLKNANLNADDTRRRMVAIFNRDPRHIHGRKVNRKNLK